MPLPVNAYRDSTGGLHLTWEEAAAFDAVPFFMALLPIEGDAERRVVALERARAMFVDDDPSILGALENLANLMQQKPSGKVVEMQAKGRNRSWSSILAGADKTTGAQR